MAGERGYILGPRAGGEVSELLRRRGEREQPRTARPRDPLVCFVRVTSGTATDGWYPGQWQETQADASLADGGDALVRAAGSGALASGDYCLSQCVGMDADGVPQFRTVPAGGGGAPSAGGANDLTAAAGAIPTGNDITASGEVLVWGISHNYDGADFWDGQDAPSSGNTGSWDVITFPSAGRYLVEVGITWAANSTGDRHLVLQWGTALDSMVRSAVSQRACASGVTRQSIVATGEVDADEVMAVRVMQDSGGDLAVSSGLLQVTFWPG